MKVRRPRFYFIIVRKEYLAGDLKATVDKALETLKRAVGPRKKTPIPWSESHVLFFEKMKHARSFESCP